MYAVWRCTTGAGRTREGQKKITMSFLVKATLLLLLGAQTVSSTALDDYVWKADPNYNWVDMVSGN
jgi:hypothetical protein